MVLSFSVVYSRSLFHVFLSFVRHSVRPSFLPSVIPFVRSLAYLFIWSFFSSVLYTFINYFSSHPNIFVIWSKDSHTEIIVKRKYYRQCEYMYYPSWTIFHYTIKSVWRNFRRNSLNKGEVAGIVIACVSVTVIALIVTYVVVGRFCKLSK